MNTVAIRRRARRPAPTIPTGDVIVPAPPARTTGGPSRWTQLIMVVPMLAGTVATALLFAGRQGGAYSYVVGGVFGLSSLGMLATSMMTGAGRRDRVDIARVRRGYLETLQNIRAEIRENCVAQRAAMVYRHPAPATLASLSGSFRLWERSADDADFGAVRVGLGPQGLTTPLVPALGTDDADPVCAAAARRLVDAHSIVADLPVAIAIPTFAHVYTNDAGLVRALVAQLAFGHPPEDLLIAVCAAPDRQGGWDYVKWLPHAHHPSRRDGVGPARLVSERLADLEALLGDVIGTRSQFTTAPARAARGLTPLVVVVIDGGDRTGAGRLASRAGVAGCCIIDLAQAPASRAGDSLVDPPDRTAITLSVIGDRLAGGDRLIADGDDTGAPDTLSIVEAEALARALAPVRLTGDVPATAETRRAITLDGLLGLDQHPGRLAAAISQNRSGRTPGDRLRVPIGLRSDGAPLLLDLKEAARDGIGPHGLLIGATGSGKSELLRTLVLGLAASHDSETLNFVLIDFKGGATFASLDRLPHTAAVITNLADELPLVDRMADALNDELVRRQEMLRDAGNLASLHDYERARVTDPELPPMAVLLIVCDEFSELLSAKPEFIDLFVAIGRLGRSLGVHLLLASQRLDEGRLRGLDTHLSYRIGLRTFSAMESRAVLGVPDAFELPRSPGHGYLKSGTEPLVRFKAAYSSGPIDPRPLPVADVSTTAAWRILPFTTSPVRAAQPLSTALPQTPAEAASLIEVMTDAMAGIGTPAHRVWLPPLSVSDSVQDLLGPLTHDPPRGLTTTDPGLRSRLRVPVAVIDKPFEQRRDLLRLSLAAAAGHVVIVGAPQSGKSALVRTLICSLALTHTPREATFYCLDFGGGALGALRDLPHVGGVVGRLATDAVRRMVGEVATLLTARERQFAAGHIDSIAQAREADALGDYGDVFLVIDGWATSRTDFDDLEPSITDIATRGLSYGVHVIITAGRWADLRPTLRDLLGSRLELRLGDPSDSQIGRKAAAMVPASAPGRGLTLDGRHFLAAAPHLTGGGIDDLVKAINDAWTGPAAPAVRQLPPLMPYEQLPEPAVPAGDLVFPIGIAETDLSLVTLDFTADPHLLIFGEPASGKSSALRSIAASIIRQYQPEQARLVVVDYRRSMLGEIDGDHLIGYATADGPAAPLLASVAEYMRKRLPGPDVTPREIRARSWWTGPECFVLVDDYDLVASGTNPLTSLLEFLPQARDVGLHLIIARRSGGAGRALFEPTMARLRELATPGIILSGDREEGAHVGTTRPQALPPGRAIFVNRPDGARLVQLAYLAPTEP